MKREFKYKRRYKLNNCSRSHICKTPLDIRLVVSSSGELNGNLGFAAKKLHAFETETIGTGQTEYDEVG